MWYAKYLSKEWLIFLWIPCHLFSSSKIFNPITWPRGPVSWTVCKKGSPVSVFGTGSQQYPVGQTIFNHLHIKVPLHIYMYPKIVNCGVQQQQWKQQKERCGSELSEIIDIYTQYLCFQLSQTFFYFHFLPIVERQVDGTLNTASSGTNTRTCEACVANTRPNSAGTR